MKRLMTLTAALMMTLGLVMVGCSGDTDETKDAAGEVDKKADAEEKASGDGEEKK